MSRKQKLETNKPEVPSKQEMQEALLRSGYLMEGRLVKMLDGLELFVESNNSYLDEKSGISREIDLIAETGRFDTPREKVCVKTTFVIEAINNLYPVVLLTEQTWSPNAQQDEYIPYYCTPGLDVKKPAILFRTDALGRKVYFEVAIVLSVLCVFAEKE